MTTDATGSDVSAFAKITASSFSYRGALNLPQAEARSLKFGTCSGSEPRCAGSTKICKQIAYAVYRCTGLAWLPHGNNPHHLRSES